MRVAVASSDGIVINQHFGRTDSFYIYEVESEQAPKFIEKRIGKPFCHGGFHEDNELNDAIDLLSDCCRVYVLQIGKGAEIALNSVGIDAVVTRGMIAEVLV